MGARSVAGDDAESTATVATVIAKFEMAQGDHAVELGIREKALDALEADPACWTEAAPITIEAPLVVSKWWRPTRAASVVFALPLGNTATTSRALAK